MRRRLGAVARRAVYTAAEVLTLGRGISRRVDGAAVRFAPAWARYYPRCYEPAKLSFLEAHCRPGSTVVDAGAHIGLYTVVMARAVEPGGRVISFEPTPGTRRALARTVRLNGISRLVDIRAEAVTDVDGGTVTFHDTGAAMSNANRIVAGPEMATDYDVLTASIDGAVAGAGVREVACLKVDVEGAELLALRGAAATIGRCHPALALEVHPAVLGADGMAMLWDLLETAGYEVRIDGTSLRADDFLRWADGFEVQCTFGAL